ncbi:MAG: hypothetical protein G8D28_09060 [gamma proteobacterium symbiont of Phacoides pectinatus]
MERSRFFCQHLIHKELITPRDALDALDLQRREAPTFERLALESGVMDPDGVFQTLTLQARTELSFMEVAVGHGLLSAIQASRILALQQERKPRIGQILVRLARSAPASWSGS